MVRPQAFSLYRYSFVWTWPRPDHPSAPSRVVTREKSDKHGITIHTIEHTARQWEKPVLLQFGSSTAVAQVKISLKMNSRRPLGKASVRLDQISPLDLKDSELREHDSCASFPFYPSKSKRGGKKKKSNFMLCFEGVGWFSLLSGWLPRCDQGGTCCSSDGWLTGVVAFTPPSLGRTDLLSFCSYTSHTPYPLLYSRHVTPALHREKYTTRLLVWH